MRLPKRVHRSSEHGEALRVQDTRGGRRIDSCGLAPRRLREKLALRPDTRRQNEAHRGLLELLAILADTESGKNYG